MELVALVIISENFRLPVAFTFAFSTFSDFPEFSAFPSSTSKMYSKNNFFALSLIPDGNVLILSSTILNLAL